MRFAPVLIVLSLAVPILAVPVPANPGCTDNVPPNDCRVNATVITTRSVDVRQSNVQAGVEPGEPLGPDMGNTIWWKFTPPYASRGSFTVSGSDHQAGVVVYEQQADGSLLLLDYASGWSSNPWTDFTCVAGRTYFVQAGGEEGVSGTIHLRGNSCLPTVPEAVTGMWAAPGTARGEIRLQWDAPANGGAPLQSYRIERSPEGCAAFQLVATVPASTTLHVEAGLVEGRTYCYRVAAVNEVGGGPWSATSESTPRGVPGAVRHLILTATSDTRIYASWFHPLHDGGSEVLSYRVWQRAGSPDGPWELLVDRFGNNVFIGNIPPGTTIYLRVTAVNAYGEGPYVQGSARTHTTPTEPLAVNARAVLPTGVRVDWQPPADTGGVGISQYAILRGDRGGPLSEIGRVSGTTLVYLDRFPSLLKTYDYAVVAINPYGSSPTSARDCGGASSAELLDRC